MLPIGALKPRADRAAEPLSALDTGSDAHLVRMAGTTATSTVTTAPSVACGRAVSCVPTVTARTAG
ncbi:hypothetical protein [Streptomyces sp. MST-110588]|uniref:hypothetical protein n=1 Tax=Streptomyces sp. MST-110588 TaxID=2833628 RepID=UPI001F5DF9DB|nr:hypothetical protein [Streptomyces sp. MST-110588]UNO43418.1 hypothetical protein KGS77_32985 [Streptomyces sp. MST-110588]